MTSPAQEGLNLADLIRHVKGDPNRGGMRYEDLAARRPIGDDGKPYGPDADRLEQMVNTPLKTFPHPKSIAGLAIMLRVTEQTVLDACARSLGLKITRTPSRLEMLLPNGIEDLPDSVIESFLTMLRHQVEAHQAAANPPKSRGRRA